MYKLSRLKSELTGAVMLTELKLGFMYNIIFEF